VTDGVKVRATWRPKAMTPDSPWYAAVNFEVGQLSNRFYPDTIAGEVKFIGLYKKDAWTLGANLNFDRALRSHTKLGTNSELDSKIAYRLPSSGASEVQVGMENYAFLGTLRQQPSSPIRTNSTFLVTDFVYKRWDYNIGVGKATGVSSDRWLVKAILGMPLD
jgi:hypothetical protein